MVDEKMEDMIYEVCYRSIAKTFLGPKDIDAILAEATNFNAAHDITGCLVCHKGCFVQILEGEKSVTRKLYAAIQKDHRHDQVQLLHEDHKAARTFDQWSMAFYKFDENSIDQKILTLFENNLLLLSEFIEKPTTTIRLFWIHVHKIIAKK